MKKESTFTMPKTALLLCYFFCGNFILSGYTAEQCPKNPLKPTSSISGMVVGSIVGIEKLVNGVVSYFYYMGENTVNQVLSVSSNFEGYVSKLIMKVEGFASGVIGGIGGQLKSIYSASSGSVRVIFDSVINMENSVQSFAYSQTEKLAESVMNGKVTVGIKDFIKNPFNSISKGFGKAKGSTSKLSSNIKEKIKKVVNSVKTSGVPSDIKDILMSPVRGVQTFTKETQSVINTVKNEASERFSNYSSEFKNGGIIDKFVAVGSFPVGAGLEVWSFTLKISEAVIKSVSVSTKDVVQPFLGQVLTERLGKVVMLPMDVIEGFYKSSKNVCSQIGGVIAKVTGGGSIGVQINMVMKHPLTVAENAWNTTKGGVKGISNGIIGSELTEKLAGVVGSPEKALSSVISSIMNNQLGQTLSSFVTKPLTYFKKAGTKIEMMLKRITTGIVGEKYSSKIFEILSAPGKTLSDMISSITGGGSISVQIKSVFGHPLQTAKNVFATIKTTIEKTIISITGGGSLSKQISTVLTSPITITEHLWNSTKSGMKDVSKLLFGGTGTKIIEKFLSAPMSSISKLTASITGGGTLSTQIKTVASKPLETIKNIWQKTKSSSESLTSTLFGSGFTQSLKKLFSSPLSAVSGFYNSISSKLGGVSASINISGGGISSALKTFVNAPVEVFKGTFKGLEKATHSVMNGFKGLFNSLPIVGNSGSIKASVNGGGKGSGAELNLGVEG